MGVYDVSSANTNRVVRFKVEPVAVADRNAALFGIQKGRNDSYPNYGRLTTAATANQELAFLRTSLVARALSRYAILVGVKLSLDSAGTGSPGTANFGSALELHFEVNERGEFYNNAWPTGAVPTITNTKFRPGLIGDANSSGDPALDTLVDTIGIGGMTIAAKSKLGLNGLLASLATVTYDGTTGPFGSLSSTGNITLPGGAVTSGAPTLATAGVNAAGLRCYLLP